MGDHRVIDQAIANLVQHRQGWLAVTAAQRQIYLQKCMGAVQQVSAAWVEAAVTAKSGVPTDLLRGEEWAAGCFAVFTNDVADIVSSGTTDSP